VQAEHYELEGGHMKQPELFVSIRHAQSLINVVRPGVGAHFTNEGQLAQISGLPDHKIPLTEQGWAQARATGVYLREKFGEFDVAYDSNYLRTAQTLDGILEAYSPQQRAALLRRHSHLIRERERGYTFHMTQAEIGITFPWFQQYSERHGYFYSRPPGGQSPAEMCDQALMFLEHELTNYAGKRVLEVVHGGTMRAQRYVLEHWTPEQLEEAAARDDSRNCGITVYRYCEKGRRLKLESYDTVVW
jgi:broad specificity phosphatase PhoE